jgi:rubrerythrin
VLKFAAFEVLSSVLVPENATRAELRILAHKHSFDYEPRPGFLYVRSRAISSRCNDNFDEFPAEEIKKGFRTFIGKPVFVNHNNDNHRRARGVVIDAALHEDKNPDGSPDIWVEALMEVDAIRFPKLAKAILAGEIARTSMGTDVEHSICSICNNRATTPAEYCAHIPRMKGQRIYRHTANGKKEGILVREICYGLKFFENSLLVEPPADPTAYFLGVDTRGLDKAASKAPVCGQTTAGGQTCGKAAKGRGIGNAPLCGTHLRAAAQRGEETRDLSKDAAWEDSPDKIQTNERCEECGKPKDHIHISPEAQDEMRAASEAGQMHAEMYDSAQKRVVNTKDPVDLKAHMMEAHDWDDGDFSDMEHHDIHAEHNHEHTDHEYAMPGTTMGDSHFHTAMRKKASEPDEVHRGLDLPAAGEESDPGKELGRHMWNGFVNAMGFDSTEEMKLHTQNKDSEALRERFKGGSGKHGFEDQQGGDAYYEVRHPSGWTARAYNGGPNVQVGHVATGDEAHDVIDVADHSGPPRSPYKDSPDETYHETRDASKRYVEQRAAGNSHEMGPWEENESGSSSAHCKNCGRSAGSSLEDVVQRRKDDPRGQYGPPGSKAHMNYGSVTHVPCEAAGGGRPKMPDSYGHEDLKNDLHEWVQDYGNDYAHSIPKIDRWQKSAARKVGISDEEFDALTSLPPLDLPSARGHGACKSCGTPMLGGEGDLCPACQDEGGGRKSRQRQKLVRTVSGLRVEAAYYGEEGSHPPKGEVGPRGPHPEADSQPSWYRRQGNNYQFHADGDQNCEHQNGENSSWREPTDHCEGHHNPPHPMQAAIEKFNNYKGRRSHVPLENNTWIHKDDQDNFHIRHHNTDIISVAPNGDTTVNVNGWHSATTGKRLHTYLPNNVQKMRNPSKARGASEHVLAINPKSSGSGGGVYANYDKPETKAKFGFHTDTQVHPYTDGISFNAKTGEKLDNDNAVRPTSDPVRPPQARGTEDPGPPARRRGPREPGGWHYSPTRSHDYEPPFRPSPSFGEGHGEPGEGYSREHDQQEVQRAERSVGHDSYGGDSMHASGDDMPAENESFDDWMNRTAPAAKAANPISKCDKCNGRGRTGPYGSKTDCRKCEGAGYLNEEGKPHKSAAIYVQAMRRYALARVAYGEVKAPAEVDTLRDEECPVCGETDSYDGAECKTCGFIAPPKMFQDPDLDVAKSMDLRQQEDELQDMNAGMPEEVPGSEFAGTDDTTVDENGEVVDPAMVGDDGSIAGPQVADDQAVVDGEVRTLGDEPMDPTQIDEEGNIIDPNLDPDAATGHFNQGGEPFTPGPNMPTGPGGPEGPEGPMEEAEESPEAGFPGTPGDNVPDLTCPSCGFQAPGSTPTSTNMNDPMAPVGQADGLLAGDVCPNCKRATLLSVGEINQQEQAVEQMQGLNPV